MEFRTVALEIKTRSTARACIDKMSSLVHGGSAEFDLLCSVARPRPNHQRALDILRRGVNWHVLLRLAGTHAVRPHLIQVLRDLGWNHAPPDAQSALRTF